MERGVDLSNPTFQLLDFVVVFTPAMAISSKFRPTLSKPNARTSTLLEKYESNNVKLNPWSCVNTHDASRSRTSIKVIIVPGKSSNRMAKLLLNQASKYPKRCASIYASLAYGIIGWLAHLVMPCIIGACKEQ